MTAVACGMTAVACNESVTLRLLLTVLSSTCLPATYRLKASKLNQVEYGMVQRQHALQHRHTDYRHS